MDKIGIGWAFVSETGKRLVNEMLDANRLSQGPMVRRFEKEFARLHEQKYGVALNSGTSALHVGLEAMKEKFGWNTKPLRGGGSFTGNNLHRLFQCLFARGIESRFR